MRVVPSRGEGLCKRVYLCQCGRMMHPGHACSWDITTWFMKCPARHWWNFWRHEVYTYAAESRV